MLTKFRLLMNSNKISLQCHYNKSFDISLPKNMFCATVYNLTDKNVKSDNHCYQMSKIDIKCRWEVWRIDDNGNEFKIDCFHNFIEAKDLITKLTEHQHKQHYWIEDIQLAKKVA